MPNEIDTKQVEDDDGDEKTISALSGYRTYLMGLGIIVHQIASTMGVDVPEQLWSHIIDVVLGIGVVYYRFKAKQ